MSSNERSRINRSNKTKPGKIKVSTPPQFKEENPKKILESTGESRDKPRTSLKFPANPTNSNERATIQPQAIQPNKHKHSLLENFTANDALQKAIEEIESFSSSSESTQEFIEMEEENDKTNFFLIEEPQKFLMLDMLSDDESLTDEEEPEYLKQRQLEKEDNFFDEFGDIPLVDQVSVDFTDDLLVEKLKTVEIDPTIEEDTGKFVNPLTGVASSSSTMGETYKQPEEDHSSTEQSLSEISPFEENDKEERMIQMHTSDVSSVDITDKDSREPLDEFDKIKEHDPNVDEILQQFFEQEKQQDETQDNLAHEEHKLQNQQDIFEFLNSLIDQCVTKSEYIDANNIYRKSLDKNKLMLELKAKYDVFRVEKRASQFLNRKCVEHFKRKLCFRVITPDDPKILKMDSKDYHTALDHLHKLLYREENTKILSSNQLLMIQEQFQNAKKHSDQEVKQLEELIKTTFQRENFERLATSVNNSLAKMSMIRKEISQVRLRLLLNQQQVTSLSDQLKNMEDLGNGLNLTKYETIETETLALNKKIEERNMALRKLHNQYNFDLHKIAHLKEKQKMMRHIVNVQKQYLKELQEQKNKLRTLLTQFKVERKNLRLEIRNQSFQCGLLDKPILLRDYDVTVETIEKLRPTVEDLKSTIDRLATKISVLETIKCKENSMS